MDDLISRQAAIDALMVWEEESIWDEECLEHRGEPFLTAPSDVVEQLPSAQPDVTGINVGDMVSRQAAIDGLMCLVKQHECDLMPDLLHWTGVKAMLESLPSAQRTGRWIVVSDGYGNGEATACICECSECKDTIWVYKKSDRKWKYCPNCGARMEEQE